MNPNDLAAQKKQQADSLLEYLLIGNWITAMKASEELGIASFHRRLTDLKKRGWVFYKEWMPVPTRYGSGMTKVYRYAIDRSHTGDKA